MAKGNISEIVRGMGMGMKILELLVSAAKEQGADEEVFALLTRPRFKHNLTQIGKTIADCDWRIPASEMRRLSRQSWRSQFNLAPEVLTFAENLWWCECCRKFGIPFSSYSQNPDHGEPAIPRILLRGLYGKKMEYPLIFSPYSGVPDCRLVVVNFETKSGKILRIGDSINIDEIEGFATASCRFFDFNK